MEDYESVLCVKNEVFVYRIPARTSNRGYRFVTTLRVFVGFVHSIFLSSVCVLCRTSKVSTHLTLPLRLNSDSGA